MAKRRRKRRAGGMRAPDPNGGAGASGALEVKRADPPPEDGMRQMHRRPAQAFRADHSAFLRKPPERLAALDLGTNNCRLLIASPRKGGFRIVDAFSRIVRLGEGLGASGALSDAAMERAIEALRVCAEKIERRGATRIRCIATQACRSASNGQLFLARVEAETGLTFEIIAPEEEARLAVAGCAEFVDGPALVFDIGGGSTELSFVRPRGGPGQGCDILAWHSMPVGVVSLSEQFGGRDLSHAAYEEIVGSIRAELAAFGDPAGLGPAFRSGAAHLLGTSGTVTSIAGVHLRLPRYRRDAVDGLWLTREEVREVADRLRAMTFAERAAEPCIGGERADLVVCGCAILDALLLEWPASRIRVADRGLREGILAGLVQPRRKRRKRRGRPAKAGPFDSKPVPL